MGSVVIMEDKNVCVWFKDWSGWCGDSHQRRMAVALQTHSGQALKDYGEEQFFQEANILMLCGLMGSG